MGRGKVWPGGCWCGKAGARTGKTWFNLVVLRNGRARRVEAGRGVVVVWSGRARQGFVLVRLWGTQGTVMAGCVKAGSGVAWYGFLGFQSGMPRRGSVWRR